MLCKNCGKEIDEKQHCPFCGYDPAIDEAGQPHLMQKTDVPPICVTYEKTTNGCAVVGFVLSFLSWTGILCIPSFLLNFIGFFKAKKCHSGRVLAMWGLFFNVLPFVFAAFVFIAIVQAVGGVDELFSDLIYFAEEFMDAL